MAKPAIFQWATNVNYATGPSVGTPTKIAPSAGQIQDGFVPTTAAIPQHVNYAIDALADWAVTYLNNLHAETDFTGQSIAWGGNNTHAGAEVFNGAATFNSTFSVPGAASIGTVNATTVNTTNIDCTGTITNSGGAVTINDQLVVTGNANVVFLSASSDIVTATEFGYTAAHPFGRWVTGESFHAQVPATSTVTFIDGEAQLFATEPLTYEFFLPQGVVVTDLIIGSLIGGAGRTATVSWLTRATGAWTVTPIVSGVALATGDTTIFSGSSAAPLGGKLLIRVDLQSGDKLYAAYVGYNADRPTLDVFV